jgi:uncharacterized protein DUF4962/heparinase II/III-like protein
MRFLVMLLPALVLAVTPDRAPLPDEWGFRPADGAAVSTNPPPLSWVHEREAASYTVEWARRADFADAVTVADIPWSVYTHHQPLAPGAWHWRYRIVAKDGAASAWSRTRAFTVPPEATAFPQPTMAELRRRMPKQHPRLFLTADDLPKLQQQPALDALRGRADQLLRAEPTPEPPVKASASDPQTVQYWWSNRMQTIKACQEAEILSLVYLLTHDPQYAAGARRWILHLAAWDPDGSTNWRLNDEAAMPILHRLARAYDWAYDALSDEERRRVREVMRRRASDAWSVGLQQGAGHLNQPYRSHANRAWHKLGEVAIAAFDEIPEAEQWLRFAVTKFYGAYPVWSDDDGGWHEGLDYWAGYMVKAAWWMDASAKALGIDGFKKPFFAHFADYALYTAPPGSPNGGFGDLSSRGASPGWSFVHYFAGEMRNPYWTWWARQWKIREESGEPALGFIWGARPKVEPTAPANLAPSKVFRGIGVAVLNSNLLSAAENVQVRFKSSPLGRQSHGHDPHNSFTLNAYGAALLVNNVYRDLYGSPFHKDWCWSTKSQNALLVDGEGQRPHTADPLGRIVKAEFQDGLDYVAGDAAAAYEGKLRKFVRHVIFVKPDVVIIADDVEAAKPATFQWMLHGLEPFELREGKNQFSLEHGGAGVLVDYVVSGALKIRQWDGYDPQPNNKYLDSVRGARLPNQWHVEASTTSPREKTLMVTVLRPYRKGNAPQGAVEADSGHETMVIPMADGTRVSAGFQTGGKFARIRKGGRQWIIE